MTPCSGRMGRTARSATSMMEIGSIPVSQPVFSQAATRTSVGQFPAPAPRPVMHPSIWSTPFLESGQRVGYGQGEVVMGVDTHLA